MSLRITCGERNLLAGSKEDRVFACISHKDIGLPNISSFGVYDGHGGVSIFFFYADHLFLIIKVVAAEYCKTVLHAKILRNFRYLLTANSELCLGKKGIYDYSNKDFSEEDTLELYKCLFEYHSSNSCEELSVQFQIDAMFTLAASDACLEVNKDIQDMTDDGTTVSSVFIHTIPAYASPLLTHANSPRIYCVNVGDSRSVLTHVIHPQDISKTEQSMHSLSVTRRSSISNHTNNIGDGFRNISPTISRLAVLYELSQDHNLSLARERDRIINRDKVIQQLLPFEVSTIQSTSISSLTNQSSKVYAESHEELKAHFSPELHHCVSFDTNKSKQCVEEYKNYVTEYLLNLVKVIHDNLNINIIIEKQDNGEVIVMNRDRKEEFVAIEKGASECTIMTLNDSNYNSMSDVAYEHINAIKDQNQRQEFILFSEFLKAYGPLSRGRSESCNNIPFQNTTNNANNNTMNNINTNTDHLSEATHMQLPFMHLCHLEKGTSDETGTTVRTDDDGGINLGGINYNYDGCSSNNSTTHKNSNGTSVTMLDSYFDVGDLSHRNTTNKNPPSSSSTARKQSYVALRSNGVSQSFTEALFNSEGTMSLLMTRSIGDRDAAKSCSCIPEITACYVPLLQMATSSRSSSLNDGYNTTPNNIDIPPTYAHTRLIIVSDGITDVMSSEYIRRTSLKKKYSNAQAYADFLSEKALYLRQVNKLRKDDITAICCDINASHFTSISSSLGVDDFHSAGCIDNISTCTIL